MREGSSFSPRFSCIMGKRSLRFERLERRLLLAGDVKWALSCAGDLTITGDQNRVAGVDESIEIVALGNATYRIDRHGRDDGQRSAGFGGHSECHEECHRGSEKW